VPEIKQIDQKTLPRFSKKKKKIEAADQTNRTQTSKPKKRHDFNEHI
jgi:hypothetical protein